MVSLETPLMQILQSGSPSPRLTTFKFALAVLIIIMYLLALVMNEAMMVTDIRS